MTIRRCIAALMAVLGVAAACAGQTVVELRATAQAPAGAAVRLIDVARVSGEGAEELGAVVVMSAEEARTAARMGRLEVGVDDVRAALDRAGVNWGRVTLSGSAVAVRLIGGAEDGGAKRPAASAAREQEPTYETVSLDGPATVRTHIAARLAHLFGVAPEDLRLRFRAEDAALLEMRTAGRRVDVQPAASAASARIPLRVYVYTGDRITATGGVTVEVLVRREVVTATGPVERGQVITLGQVSVGARWLEPNAKTPATLEHLIAGGGAVARARIDAGEVVTLDKIEPPLAARRGDLVTVHCLSGSVTVRVRARALSDIRDGEIGAFRLEGSKKTFHARMDGRGQAVMVVDSRGPAGAMAMETGR